MIPFQLPDRLVSLVTEIEARAGRPIRWKEDKNLFGAMYSNVWKGQATIVYRDFTEEGAAHELLHLRLTYSGFPTLSCDGHLHITKQVMDMLLGAAQHIVIFPQLKEWGYNPHEAESRGIRKQLAQLEKEDLDRVSSEPDIRALFSMIYVRVFLECEDAKTQSEAERIFDDPRLQPCRALAKSVIAIFRAWDLRDNLEAHSALNEAIKVLGQSDHIEIEPSEFASNQDR